MLAEVLEFQFTINCDREWSNFLKVIRKRHALTHPKLLTDLNMSVRDYENTANAFDWFRRIFERFSKEIEKHKKIKLKFEIS